MPELTSKIQSRVRRMHSLTAKKFNLLFLSLLVYLVVYPYVQRANFGYLGFRMFGIAVTLLSVYAVSFKRRYALLALALAVPTLAQRIMLPRADSGAGSLLVTVCSFIFDLLIVVLIFRRVFDADRSNAEAIFGALCIYLLVGFSFANGYLLLTTFEPHAFYLDPSTNPHFVPGRFEFIYYSFGTLTSLGAPGITPVSDEARSLSIVEAILGVLYLAVLISRLLSMYKNQAEA